MLRQTLFRLSQQRGLRAVATSNPLAQNVARRFVAGETLPEALEAVRAINARGMSASLDHLGENITTAADALEARESAIESLRAIAEVGVTCNVSVKLTQFGLDADANVAFEHVCRVVDAAGQHNNFVRIDMEGSGYTDRTLQIVERLFKNRPNVGTVLQAALYRTESDLERLMQLGMRVRLVKGAYLEPSSIAFARKEDVDANYVKLMQRLLIAGNYPAVATHDSAIIAAVKQFADEHSIAKSRFEFQMLYGIRRDLQGQLVREGYNVRIYVPYGRQWYPYLMRRMAERPANVVFVLGNIAREASRGHS